MHKLLLAYDGSETSQHAAASAVELARVKNAAVEVLVVGEVAPSGYGSASPIVEPEVYEQVAAEGVERLRAAGVEARGKVAWGSPGEVIVEKAGEERYDAIVMGHRGHGVLSSLLLGSTAKYVMDHAHCSVLVVR
ncbi:MAG: UspA protein [Armatimonadetes bacterium]|jgi:nucleotide-binding universal stress UspA family protein|nr:UspA protein [Armatimonadota bacterium]